MIVVSNSTPLIHIGKANKLHFLKTLYRQVYIPGEVWRDLMKPIEDGWAEIPQDVSRIQEAKEQGWLLIKDPQDPNSLELVAELSISLGVGESFAIALSKELKADVLLVNDKGAIDKAEELGIKTKWVSEILHDALAAGLLQDAKEYEELLGKMMKAGLWITIPSFNKAVAKAREVERASKGGGSK